MLNMPPKAQQARDQVPDKKSDSKLKVPAGKHGHSDLNSGTLKPEPYDNHLNFIYVVQPFTQVFARILYPYEESNYEFDKMSSNGLTSSLHPDSYYNHSSMAHSPSLTPVLFINDEYLIGAEGEDIKFAKTDKIFSLVGRRAGGNSNLDDNQLYAPLTNS